MIKKEKAIREYLQTLTKDLVIELCLQYIYDKNVVETQLEEKEKMHLLDEKEFQHYCAYKQIESKIKGCLDREREYKNQLAIQELEKLKDFAFNVVVINQIDQQIKELSGGKNGKF